MVVAMGILFGFYLAVASLFAPLLGIPVIVAGSVLFVGLQYVVGKKLALRSVGARRLHPEEHPEIHERVERLADDMAISKPALKVGRMGVPNAFAVGRKGAGTVVVSETMLALVEEGHVSMDELEGVLAHELAHVKNRDVIVMLLGQSVASIVALTVFFVVRLVTDDVPLVGFLVAYLASIVTQMLVMVFVLAISRYREYVADEDAAEYTGDPEALASALAIIAEVGSHEEAADVEGSTAAMCIFGGERGLLAAVFATHPPIEKRIDRLAAMA
jgi:heat shock protein HtpX